MSIACHLDLQELKPRVQLTASAWCASVQSAAWDRCEKSDSLDADNGNLPRSAAIGTRQVMNAARHAQLPLQGLRADFSVPSGVQMPSQLTLLRSMLSSQLWTESADCLLHALAKVLVTPRRCMSRPLFVGRSAC